VEVSDSTSVPLWARGAKPPSRAVRLADLNARTRDAVRWFIQRASCKGYVALTDPGDEFLSRFTGGARCRAVTTTNDVCAWSVGARIANRGITAIIAAPIETVLGNAVYARTASIAGIGRVPRSTGAIP